MDSLKRYHILPPFAVLGLFVFGLGTCKGAYKTTDTDHTGARAPSKGGQAISSLGTGGSNRIVSVGGAITETVYALGFGADVVGVDTSSVYPAEALELPKVGYQRRLSAEGVLSLSPTLVVLSSHAGPPEVLEQLRAAGTHVLILPGAPGLENTYERINKLGVALGHGEGATSLINSIRTQMASVRAGLRVVKEAPRVLSVYARGQGSVSVAGKNTAAEMVVSLAGGTSLINEYEGYRPITAESVIAAEPDFILIPARGLESRAGVEGLLRQPGISQTRAGLEKKVIVIDDLLLLGFGPRTPEAVRQLASAMGMYSPPPVDSR